MMNLEEIKLAAKGKWIGIFQQLGIEVPLPPGKSGACPICKNGVDRFSLDKDTTDGLIWYCRQCSPTAGDGLSLVQKSLGFSFQETIKRISDILGLVERDKITPKPNTDTRKILTSVWKSSSKITGSDPVSKYLHSRKLTLTPDNIRYCPECYESSTKKKFQAMVALIQNKDGKPVSIHRTYLEENKKANIESPKKIMPATESLVGSAIRLFKPGDMMLKPDTLGVAEGICTAISATQLFNVATWAVLSSTIMEGFEPPEGIRKVVIFGDADFNHSGERAAYILANKLYNKDLLVDVVIPEKRGSDWNTVVMEAD